LDTIYLAGGSTRLPLVRQFLTQYFGRSGSVDLDPLAVVAMGASMPAASMPAASAGQ
jgi:molecular chaperone DnaK (HSP70)